MTSQNLCRDSLNLKPSVSLYPQTKMLYNYCVAGAKSAILDYLVIIIRPHCSTTQMRPIVTHRVVWSVCWSWSLQQWLNWSSVTWAGRGTMYYMEVQIPQCKGAIWGGKRTAHCEVWGLSAVSPAKTAEPIDMPFWVWTRVGPGNHVLDGDAYWRNLVNTTEPSMCGSDVTICQVTSNTYY